LEEHGHGKRGGLAFAPRAIDQTFDKLVNVGASQRLAVAFVADDFLGKHARLKVMVGS
jgi:hypothetical protein